MLDCEERAIKTTTDFKAGVEFITGVQFKKAIRKRPPNKMLTKEEEYALIRAYKEGGDHDAGAVLVERFLPMVYGLAYKMPPKKSTRDDMVGDGVLGLYKALMGFDVDRGLRFSTYATGWVKNSIIEGRENQNHHLKTTTTKERKTFMRQLGFIENRFRHKHPDLNQGELDATIADYFGVTTKFIGEIRGLRSGVSSLNAPVGGADGEGASWIDWLESGAPSTEQTLGNNEELDQRKTLLVEAFEDVCSKDRQPDRARDILHSRKLAEETETLEVVGVRHSISKERVRQIEKGLFEKLQQRVLILARNKGLVP